MLCCVGRLMNLLRANLGPFLCFACVGVVNTLIHLAVLATLVEVAGWTHPLANVGAFLVANAFSYWANSRWSFGFPLSRRRYGRFLATSVVGAVLSYGVMRFGDARGWHYLFSYACQLVLMPLVNFALLRWWVFPGRGAEESAPEAR